MIIMNDSLFSQEKEKDSLQFDFITPLKICKYIITKCIFTKFLVLKIIFE